MLNVPIGGEERMRDFPALDGPEFTVEGLGVNLEYVEHAVLAVAMVGAA